MLMSPDRTGVDADGPLDVADGVVLDDDLVQQAFPGAVGGPDPQPLVSGLPGSVALGQVPPRCSGTQLPQDRVDHLTVITPPPATALDRRQQWLDPCPGLVGQLTAPHHPAMITDRRWQCLQDTP